MEQVRFTSRLVSVVEHHAQPHRPATTFGALPVPEANEIAAEAMEWTPSLTDLQIPADRKRVKRL